MEGKFPSRFLTQQFLRYIRLAAPGLTYRVAPKTTAARAAARAPDLREAGCLPIPWCTLYRTRVTRKQDRGTAKRLTCVLLQLCSFWSGRGKTSYNRKRVYSPQLLSWQHAYQ